MYGFTNGYMFVVNCVPRPWQIIQLALRTFHHPPSVERRTSDVRWLVRARKMHSTRGRPSVIAFDTCLRHSADVAGERVHLYEMRARNIDA